MIGVVVSARVQAARAAEFEEGLADLMRAAAARPGRISADVLRGTVGPGGRDYHVVYRFADEASLRDWEASPERRALLARIEPLFEEAGRRELTGMEAWFDLPRGAPAPARWRMAVLTWLGIWPLVSLSLWLFAPHLAGLPFLLQTALNSALLVLAMTYVVMPWLAHRAAPLLYPRRH
jgi:antibiotic biosynthesis monooxygenase (ABM) superfamily enzyme